MCPPTQGIFANVNALVPRKRKSTCASTNLGTRPGNAQPSKSVEIGGQPSLEEDRAPLKQDVSFGLPWAPLPGGFGVISGVLWALHSHTRVPTIGGLGLDQCLQKGVHTQGRCPFSTGRGVGHFYGIVGFLSLAGVHWGLGPGPVLQNGVCRVHAGQVSPPPPPPSPDPPG